MAPHVVAIGRWRVPFDIGCSDRARDQANLLLPPTLRCFYIRRFMYADSIRKPISRITELFDESQESLNQDHITIDEFDLPICWPPWLCFLTFTPIDHSAEQQHLPLGQLTHRIGGTGEDFSTVGGARSTVVCPPNISHPLRVLLAAPHRFMGPLAGYALGPSKSGRPCDANLSRDRRHRPPFMPESYCASTQGLPVFGHEGKLVRGYDTIGEGDAPKACQTTVP